MERKTNMKRDITDRKELTYICIPSVFFTEYEYQEMKLTSMLYIYLALGKNLLCKQPFIFNDFVRWYSQNETSSHSYIAKIKKEVMELFEKMENRGLIKVLDSHSSYCQIELKENFYTFSCTRTFDNFVVLYVDELEKIMRKKYTVKKDGFTRNMLLNVFLYMKILIGSNNGCYQNYINTLAKNVNINKNTLSKILKVLSCDLELIYSKTPSVEWTAERNGFYYDKTIFTCYYKRDLKNKVEIYGSDYITECINNYKDEN